MLSSPTLLTAWELTNLAMPPGACLVLSTSMLTGPKRLTVYYPTVFRSGIASQKRKLTSISGVTLICSLSYEPCAVQPDGGHSALRLLTSNLKVDEFLGPNMDLVGLTRYVSMQSKVSVPLPPSVQITLNLGFQKATSDMGPRSPWKPMSSCLNEAADRAILFLIPSLAPAQFSQPPMPSDLTRLLRKPKPPRMGYAWKG